MPEITITSLRLGDLRVEIENPEGATLKEILDELGIQQNGQQFVINGRPETATTDTATRVRPGDRVEVADRPKAGF